MRSTVLVGGLLLTLLGAAIPAAGQQGLGRGSERQVVSLPSGRRLSSPVVEGLTRQLRGNAQALFKSAVCKTTIMKDKTPLFTSSMNYGGSLALYTYHQKKLTGDAIFFWPDMDPVTCYRNYRMLQRLAAGQPGRPGQPGQPGQPAQPVDKASIWDDVGLRCYVQYDKKSRRSGPMVCWDENGGKRFYCEYDEGEPEGVCCLFDQDQLQAVLECQEGKVNTVTLVANWAVTRKMLSRAEAMADTEGKAMIDKFNETEQQLKKESKAFHEAHKKSFQAGVAAVTVGKRGNMLANEARLEAERAESMRQIANTVKAAPASQSYFWSPGNNYSPLNVGSLYGPPE